MRADAGSGRPNVWAGTAQRNGVAAQHERLIQRLRQGWATRAELEFVCNSPSVTKRLSELRRLGWPIESEWVSEIAPDRSIRKTKRYRLREGDTPAQDELFQPR